MVIKHAQGYQESYRYLRTLSIFKNKRPDSWTITAEYFEKSATIAMWYLEQVLELSNMDIEDEK